MTAKKPLTLEKFEEIAVITFDLPKHQLNILNQNSLADFPSIIQKIEEDYSIKAVVIISGKEDNFVAGADLHELAKAKTAREAEALCLSVQVIFNAIEQSKKIYIAAIHGATLGGGLELALACHFRIATLDKKTIFSFPEVNLGFLPAAGGTQRLPRLIGVSNALKMLLMGKRIHGKEALKIGLIDQAVNTRDELKAGALAFARLQIAHKKAPSAKKILWWSLPLLWIAKKNVFKKTHGLYQAPLAIVDVVATGIAHGMTAGLLAERKQFGKLFMTTTSQNLVHLFFAQKERQKNPFGEKPTTPIENIGIMGSGLMGAGIAYISLLKNFHVYLNDNERTALSSAEVFIASELKQCVVSSRLSPSESARLTSNLSVSTDYANVECYDAVIEAVFEDLAVKRQLLKKLEPRLKPQAIFATNTSSLPIGDIASGSSIKDRIVGMHYFSPVPKVPLLEIVKGKHTSNETLKKAAEIGLRQGKTIIVVNDSPGFYTTRIIAALLDEASILLLEGHNPRDIDRELQNIGFPMGPVTLMDEIGLDVGLHVSKVLHAYFGDRLIAADMQLAENMIDNHFLGQKIGKGFYIYDSRKPHVNDTFLKMLPTIKTNSAKNKHAIADRMLLRMVNEAAYCLSENVIDSKEDGDVGAVFGVGFPPNLGGPFRYIEAQGRASIAKRLDELKDSFGERFIKASIF